MDIKNKQQKLLMKILAVVCIISTIGLFSEWLQRPKSVSTVKPKVESTQNTLPSNSAIAQIEGEDELVSKVENKEVEKNENQEIIKSQVNLNIPFTAQAPFAVWDDLHNEACEEAALIMAKYWLDGKTLTKEKAEEEILNSVAWQIKNWGGHYDLPSEKIVELGKEYFKIEKIEVFYQPTLEDIKKELSKGNLVIVPTAGRLLKNPYYRQPGPIYHMLVVRGYDEKWIITNDPGTRRGENFKYTYQNFFDSIHDWPYGSPDYGQKFSKEEKATEILNGQKVMIVVGKP